MWKFEIVSKLREGRIVRVRYTQDDEQVEEEYPVPAGASPSWFKEIVTARIDALAVRDVVFDALPAPGKIDDVATIEVPVEVIQK